MRCADLRALVDIGASSREMGWARQLRPANSPCVGRLNPTFFHAKCYQMGENVFQRDRPLNPRRTMSDEVRAVALSLVTRTALNSLHLLP